MFIHKHRTDRSIYMSNRRLRIVYYMNELVHDINNVDTMELHCLSVCSCFREVCVPTQKRRFKKWEYEK